MMNRIRTLAVTAAGAAVLAAGFGAATVGVAAPANADVCVEYYSDGTPFYYYC
ncbi:hypothetical protein [Mycolicibacterium agri]|nr:hypothetical protein [Mycolicibacterium agri]